MITSISRDIPLEKYFHQSKGISKESKDYKKLTKTSISNHESNEDKLSSISNPVDSSDDPMEVICVEDIDQEMEEEVSDTSLSNPSLSSNKIYFIRSDKNSRLMIEAYASLRKDNLNPCWLEEANAKSILEAESSPIFVINSFRGTFFETLKKMEKVRIFSPFAIIQCNPKSIEFLPERKYPILNLCMRRCYITHSNIQDLEKVLDIKNKVTSMGGQFSHKLIKKITQIVSDSWTSKKCLCARQRGIPVMSLDWVEKCWEESNKGIDAFHISFQKYRLAIFKNMNICISGFSSQSEKNKIKNMIETHGGFYSGSLHVNKTTHLIVGVKSGEKYQFAKNRNIHIVNRDWLFDSISSGYPLLESYYTMIDENEKNHILNNNMPTNIPANIPANIPENIPATKNLNQLSSSSVKPEFMVIEKTIEFKQQIGPKENSNNNLNLIIHINKLIQEMDKRRKLFDGLSFYFCGVPEIIYQPAKKLISQVGGTVYRDLVSAVTHIVYGLNTTKKEAFMINKHEEKNHTFHKVSIEWVIECVEKSKFLTEYYDSFLIPLLETKNTQDLSPTLQKKIYRERSIKKVEELGKKLKKISEKEACNGNKKVEVKGFKLGASHTPPSKLKILPKEEKDILPSIPITWLNDGKK